MTLLETRQLIPEQSIVTTFRVQEQEAFRPRKTVLLAEDNDDLRFVMECTLTAMGYLVVACADAYLAAAEFRSQRCIDVLLTDLEMPGRSGLELARELTGLRPSLPVVIITGSVLSANTLQDIHDRHWIYVSKPCHLTVLETTLRQLLDADGSKGKLLEAASR